MSMACAGVGPSLPRVSKTTAESTAASSAGCRPFHTPGAQTLGDQQVAFAVDPRQQPAVGGHLRFTLAILASPRSLRSCPKVM